MPMPMPSQMSGEYQMPAEEYRSVDALNFSTAKHALKSPLAYKAALCDKQTKATSAMELGRPPRGRCSSSSPTMTGRA